VGDLPPATQVKLLRMLQEREYEPLGATRTRRANVRVVAATNQKLAELVSQGRFRDDLYFRLAVVRLSIPPLSERRGDIPLLVEHFIGRFNAKRGKAITGVAPEVMEALMRYAFPGNVRELENLIEFAFVLCHNRMIDMNHLPEDFLAASGAGGSRPRLQPCTPGLQQAEADAIQTALRDSNGRLQRAAQQLGISPTTLWRKMKKYDLRTEDFRTA
jgi:transcriptional regulator with PAS, ATPase and Fis domain